MSNDSYYETFSKAMMNNLEFISQTRQIEFESLKQLREAFVACLPDDMETYHPTERACVTFHINSELQQFLQQHCKSVTGLKEISVLIGSPSLAEVTKIGHYVSRHWPKISDSVLKIFSFLIISGWHRYEIKMSKSFSFRHTILNLDLKNINPILESVILLTELDSVDLFDGEQYKIMYTSPQSRGQADTPLALGDSAKPYFALEVLAPLHYLNMFSEAALWLSSVCRVGTEDWRDFKCQITSPEKKSLLVQPRDLRLIQDYNAGRRCLFPNAVIASEFTVPKTKGRFGVGISYDILTELIGKRCHDLVDDSVVLIGPEVSLVLVDSAEDKSTLEWHALKHPSDWDLIAEGLPYDHYPTVSEIFNPPVNRGDEFNDFMDSLSQKRHFIGCLLHYPPEPE